MERHGPAVSRNEQGRRRGTLILVAGMAAALLAVGGTEAQEPPAGSGGEPGPTFHRIEVGAFVAQAFFPSDILPVAVSDSGRSITFRLAGAPGFGASAGVWVTRRWYLGARWVLVPTNEQAFAGGSPIGVEIDHDVAFWTGSLRFALRDAGEALVPYVVAGAGVEHHTGISEARLEPFGESDLAGSVGVGTLVDVGWAGRLRFEVCDYVSSYQPPGITPTSTRHDLLVTVGLAFGLM